MVESRHIDERVLYMRWGAQSGVGGGRGRITNASKFGFYSKSNGKSPKDLNLGSDVTSVFEGGWKMGAVRPVRGPWIHLGEKRGRLGGGVGRGGTVSSSAFEVEGAGGTPMLAVASWVDSSINETSIDRMAWLRRDAVGGNYSNTSSGLLGSFICMFFYLSRVRVPAGQAWASVLLHALKAMVQC
jgi:hypothetical protein